MFDGWVNGRAKYHTVTVRITSAPPTPEYLYDLPLGYHDITREDMAEVHRDLRGATTPPNQVGHHERLPGGWIPTCTATVPVPEDEEWLPQWDELLPGERTRAYAILAVLGEDWDASLAPRRPTPELRWGWTRRWYEHWFPHHQDEEAS